MTQSRAFDKKPMKVELAPGEHYWCACGRSSNQPFCDGSHQGGEFTPIKYVAEESKRMYFCGCKATEGAPFCDGSHSKA